MIAQRRRLKKFVYNTEVSDEDYRLRAKEHQIYLSNDPSSVPLLCIQDPPVYISSLNTGFAYVQNKSDATTTQKLVDYFFDHQDQFTEEVLIDYTLDNFLNELAALVASLTVRMQTSRKSMSKL
jgi:hypothetical protein